MHKIRRRAPSKVWAGQRDDGRSPGISGRSHFALRALPPSPLGVTAAAAAYSRLKSISRGHEHGSLSLTMVVDKKITYSKASASRESFICNMRWRASDKPGTWKPRSMERSVAHHKTDHDHRDQHNG